jgi:polysaccharide transporter, PST family
VTIPDTKDALPRPTDSSGRWLRILPGSLRRRLASRPGLVAILSNAGWLGADKILRLGLGLFVGVLIARTLGPAQFGLLSFALAVVTMFGAVGTLGLESVTVRELVRDSTNRPRVLGTVFGLKLAGSAIAALLVVLVAWLLRSGEPHVWRISAIIALGQLFLAFDVIDYVFQARLQSRYSVLAKNAAFCVVAIVRVVLVVRHASLEAFVWAIALEYVLAGVLLLATFGRVEGLAALKWEFRRDLATRLLRSSWPLVLSGLVIAIYLRIDQIMLAAMAGDAAVGVYSVAARLAEVWYFVPMALTTSTLPALIQSRERSHAEFTQRTERLFTVMVLLSVAVAIPTTLLARPVVLFLYGPEYAGSVVPLIVLTWTGVFVSLGVARESWMLAEGLMTHSFATTVWGAVINVLLNLVLIPRYGGLGAAIATLAAQIVAVSLSTLLYRSTRPVFQMQLRAISGGFLGRRR